VRSQILGMHIRKSVKFWDWAQEIHALNIILQGTNSHLADGSLHNQLEALVKPNLHSYCKHEGLNKTTDLKKWVPVKEEADERLKDDCIFMEEAALCAPYPHAFRTQVPSGGLSAKNCPKLDEHKHLMDNNGCYKCRCFNQSHRAYNCPNDFPKSTKRSLIGMPFTLLKLPPLSPSCSRF